MVSARGSYCLINQAVAVIALLLARAVGTELYVQ